MGVGGLMDKLADRAFPLSNTNIGPLLLGNGVFVVGAAELFVACTVGGYKRIGEGAVAIASPILFRSVCL